MNCDAGWPDTPLVAARVERVVDGDTIIVDFDDGSHGRVRLIGCDAAESVAPQQWRNCAEGTAASAALKGLLPAGTRVWLQRDVSDIDDYGRMLRYVWLSIPERIDGTACIREHMLNAILIERGIAAARCYPPDTSLDLLFAALGE